MFVAGPINKESTGLGDLLDGLYILQTNIPSFNCSNGSLFSTSECNYVVSNTTWHHWLGHIPTYKMKLLDIISNKNLGVLDHCSICPKARQQCLPFPL